VKSIHFPLKRKAQEHADDYETEYWEWNDHGNEIETV
jgi:hypothetical protein